jgi:nitroreductase
VTKRREQLACASVDAHLIIASKRDVKRYAGRPVPADVVERILDAGRLAGSAMNRQPWRFVVVETPERRAALAQAVYAPENVETAGLVVAITSTGRGPASFDCGRAAQNVMLAAWNEGIASSPNGIADRDRAREALDLPAEGEDVVTVLSLGYPADGRDAAARPVEEWSRRAKRLPLADVVRRV